MHEMTNQCEVVGLQTITKQLQLECESSDKTLPSVYRCAWVVLWAFCAFSILQVRFVPAFSQSIRDCIPPLVTLVVMLISGMALKAKAPPSSSASTKAPTQLG